MRARKRLYHPKAPLIRMDWLVILLLAIASVYVLAIGVAAYFSLRPLRLPLFFSPGSMGAEQEPTEFYTQGAMRLRGWWCPRDGSDVTIVFVHGYLMNRSELSPVAGRLWHEGFSCLVFDLRAHGRSGGLNTTLGWRERFDVLAAVNHAKSLRPGSKVVLFGSSMGAAASALCAAETRGLADALILDSSYSTLSSATDGWWRFVGGSWLVAVMRPLKLVLGLAIGVSPGALDIARALRTLNDIPILFLHGAEDKLARPAEAERNLAAAPDAEIVWFPGCDHVEGRWDQPDRYFDAICGFLRRRNLWPRVGLRAAP